MANVKKIGCNEFVTTPYGYMQITDPEDGHEIIIKNEDVQNIIDFLIEFLGTPYGENKRKLGNTFVWHVVERTT